MEWLPLVKGIGIGITVAAPVGPMSVLCMRRTLTTGWRLGFNTGLGIATGDAVYASIAALGLVSISRFMLAYDRPLHVIAGIFLIYLGLRAFFTRPAAEDSDGRRPAVATGYTSALLLTLTNPPTIISFAAIFTVLAPRSGFNVASALETVAGVFLGSAFWWFALTTTVALVRHALGRRSMRWIDGISGAVLGLCGVAEIGAAR